MPGMFSPKKRSEIMSLIRSKGTEAERIAFKYLRQNKIYFQKHYARVAGARYCFAKEKENCVYRR